MRRASRALVINRQNQCLLVQHHERIPEDVGKWSAIGGGLDGNEDPITGLMRELAEELGPATSAYMRIGPKIHTHHWPERQRTDFFFVVWLQADDIHPVVPDEIIGHRWFAPQELDSVATFFAIEARLYKEALKIPRP